jgi:Restriction endonuclease
VKPGEDLEVLVERIMGLLTQGESATSVERDVQVEGPDGSRQVDVLVHSRVGPLAIDTVIECKDYAGKVNVMAVDALHSKMQDLQANKAVLVARKGFSKTAAQKAARLGISLFRADMLDNVPGAVHQVPVHIRQLRQAGFKFWVKTGTSTRGLSCGSMT